MTRYCGYTRQHLGDWDVDAIVGRGRLHIHIIVSLTDPKSRLALLKKFERMANVVIELLKTLSEKTHTITAHNRKEFVKHERIANELETNVCFAHPHSSWERAPNENTYGLIRQYFPKKLNFIAITESDIEFAMERLNN